MTNPIARPETWDSDAVSLVFDPRERADRAVREFRKHIPGLQGFARAIARNPKLRLVPDWGTPRTDGSTIWLRPPMELGDELTHDLALCERRNWQDSQLCEACRVEEYILIIMMHEISHLLSDSFAEMTDDDKQEVLERTLHEYGAADGSTRAGKITAGIQALRDAGRLNNYLEAALVVSPFMPVLVNALEDVRVNVEMYKARPGTLPMFRGQIITTFEKGTPMEDGTVQKWDDAPLNAQIVIGAFAKAAKYDYENWFAPEIVESLNDDELTNILSGIDTATSVGDVYNLAFPVLERIRELGYCRTEHDLEDDEPEPQPEPEPTPEPEQDNDDEQEEAGDPDDECDGGDSDSDEDSDDTDTDDESDQGDSTPQDSDDEGDDGDDDGENPGGDTDETPQESDDGDDGDSAGEGDAPDADEDDDDGTGAQGDESDPENADTEQSDAGEQDAPSNDGEPQDADETGEPGQSTGASGEPGDGDESDDTEQSDADSAGDGSGSAGDPGDDDDFDYDESDGDLSSDDDTVGDQSTTGQTPSNWDDHPTGEVTDNDDEDDDVTAADSDDADGDDDADIDGEFQAHGEYTVQEGEWMTDEDTKPSTDLDTMGTPEEVQELLNAFGGHVEPSADGSDPNEPSEEEQQAIGRAINQGEHFDIPSGNLWGVRIHEYGKPVVVDNQNFSHGWSRYASRDSVVVPEPTLAPALLRMRRTFADNRATQLEGNLKRGRVNARVLGRRLPVGDDRLFAKKTKPAKKDYMVVIGMDISGSTAGYALSILKQCVTAQAELCARIGVDFAVYAHTGSQYSYSSHELVVEIYPIKLENEPWNDETRKRMAAITDDNCNLDGHTMEFYRKVLDQSGATEKILMYYTDGAMPMANFHEELGILERELRVCKQKGYTVMGVGVGTDSPMKYGLDTVVVNSVDDTPKVVAHLEKQLRA